MKGLTEMAKERLSKLQKWILTQTYKKTIYHNNSGLDLLGAYAIQDKKLEDKNDLYWRYLFRTEILLSYFKCETDYYKIACSKQHCFKGKNNKEQVLLTRSLQNLQDKGLIELIKAAYVSWQGIRLTERGKEKTLMLIDGHDVININIKT